MTPDPETLRDLAKRVVCNVPGHRDPERFHVEKDQIAAELRRIAMEAEQRERG